MPKTCSLWPRSAFVARRCRRLLRSRVFISKPVLPKSRPQPSSKLMAARFSAWKKPACPKELRLPSATCFSTRPRERSFSSQSRPSFPTSRHWSRTMRWRIPISTLSFIQPRTPCWSHRLWLAAASVSIKFSAKTLWTNCSRWPPCSRSRISGCRSHHRGAVKPRKMRGREIRANSASTASSPSLRSRSSTATRSTFSSMDA